MTDAAVDTLLLALGTFYSYPQMESEIDIGQPAPSKQII